MLTEGNKRCLEKGMLLSCWASGEWVKATRGRNHFGCPSASWHDQSYGLNVLSFSPRRPSMPTAQWSLGTLLVQHLRSSFDEVIGVSLPQEETAGCLNRLSKAPSSVR